MNIARYELMKLRKAGPLTEDVLKVVANDKSNRLSKLIPKSYFKRNEKMFRVRASVEVPEKPKRIKIK